MSRDSTYLKKMIKARRMVIMGYVSRIVIIETGLTQKQLRDLKTKLQNEGVNIKRRSRTIRGGATLVNSLNSKIEASMLMQLYHNIGGDKVYRSIDLSALESAYMMYSALRNELPKIQSPRWQMLDLTDAWSLAQELRSDEAWIEVCEQCKCNYFTSVNQRTSISCPYCKNQSNQQVVGCTG